MTRTLEDIAQDLGVSRRTISRYITGKGFLSKKTKGKIAEAFRIESYSPNVLGTRAAVRTSHKGPVRELPHRQTGEGKRGEEGKSLWK